MGNRIYNKIFAWMFVGLLITFLTGYYVSTNTNMLYNIFSSSLQFLIYIAEIVLVVVLSRRIKKMSGLLAKILFCLYSFVSGLTFSVLFVAFDISSVLYIFGLSSILFGIFAFLGAKTDIDLSKISTILFMGLVGIVIVSIINIFLGNTVIDIIVSWVCLAIFFAITAYDIQKINYMSTQINDDDKLAIIGALELYLDFINIFIRLISLFGKNNN